MSNEIWILKNCDEKFIKNLNYHKNFVLHFYLYDKTNWLWQKICNEKNVRMKKKKIMQEICDEKKVIKKIIWRKNRIEHVFVINKLLWCKSFFHEHFLWGNVFLVKTKKTFDDKIFVMENTLWWEEEKNVWHFCWSKTFGVDIFWMKNYCGKGHFVMTKML